MIAVAAVPEFVVCRVCHGGKKSPFGDRSCPCCNGTGQIPHQEHKVKTIERFDLAKRVRKTMEAQISALQR